MYTIHRLIYLNTKKRKPHYIWVQLISKHIQPQSAELGGEIPSATHALINENGCLFPLFPCKEQCLCWSTLTGRRLWTHVLEFHLCTLVMLFLSWCNLYAIYRGHVNQHCWNEANCAVKSCFLVFFYSLYKFNLDWETHFYLQNQLKGSDKMSHYLTNKHFPAVEKKNPQQILMTS